MHSHTRSSGSRGPGSGRRRRMCRIRIPRTGSAPRHRSRTADRFGIGRARQGAVRRGFEGRSNERAAVAVGHRLLELGDVAAAYLVERDDVRSPLVDDRSGRSHRPAGITARDSAVAQIQLKRTQRRAGCTARDSQAVYAARETGRTAGYACTVNQTTDDARQHPTANAFHRQATDRSAIRPPNPRGSAPYADSPMAAARATSDLPAAARVVPGAGHQSLLMSSSASTSRSVRNASWQAS
jgi:hypothetical protein